MRDAPDTGGAAFGSNLTESLYQIVRDRAEALIAEGRPEAEVLAAISDLRFDAILESADEPIYVGLRRGLPGLLRYIRSGDEGIAHVLDAVWGPPDRLYRAAAYLAYELGQTVVHEVPERGPKLGSLVGLHGRALRTAAEVRLLAMNGFEAGASARWRSLHELAVVGLVLREADEEISTRYQAYGDVERWQDVQQYQRHAPRLGRSLFTDEEVDAARRAAAGVVTRFGPEMTRPNGWAALLFPGSTRISFAELEERGGLGHLRPFYRLGSHHVHAGARAAELNTTTSPTGGILITTGAAVYGDIAEVCHGAMISLHQVTSALVNECISSGDEIQGPVELLMGLIAQQRFVDDAGEAYLNAYRAARDRGWVDHGEEE
jgi:hypothetical protein